MLYCVLSVRIMQECYRSHRKIMVFYQETIQPIFLQGSECWIMRKQNEKRIHTAEMIWIRKIAGISRLHKSKIRSDGIRQPLCIQTTVLDKVVQRRLR